MSVSSTPRKREVTRRANLLNEASRPRRTDIIFEDFYKDVKPLNKQFTPGELFNRLESSLTSFPKSLVEIIYNYITYTSFYSCFEDMDMCEITNLGLTSQRINFKPLSFGPILDYHSLDYSTAKRYGDWIYMGYLKSFNKFSIIKYNTLNGQVKELNGQFKEISNICVDYKSFPTNGGNTLVGININTTNNDAIKRIINLIIDSDLEQVYVLAKGIHRYDYINREFNEIVSYNSNWRATAATSRGIYLFNYKWDQIYELQNRTFTDSNFFDYKTLKLTPIQLFDESKCRYNFNKAITIDDDHILIWCTGHAGSNSVGGAGKFIEYNVTTDSYRRLPRRDCKFDYIYSMTFQNGALIVLEFKPDNEFVHVLHDPCVDDVNLNNLNNDNPNNANNENNHKQASNWVGPIFLNRPVNEVC